MKVTDPFTITLAGATWENVTIEQRGRYIVDDSPALGLVLEGWEPLADVTLAVSHRGVVTQPGCIWVKGWGECEGLPDELVRLGIAEKTGQVLTSGFPGTEMYEMRLLGEFAEAFMGGA